MRAPGPADAAVVAERLRTIGDPVATLTAMFMASPVALEVFDAAGSAIIVNPAYFALFGCAPAPDADADADPADPSDGHRGVEPMRRAFAGETVRVPARWYPAGAAARGGSRRGRIAVEATYFPLRDAKGEITHVARAFEDVTAELAAKEEAERERARAGAELARREVLAEATARLATVVTPADAVEVVPRIAVPRFADYSALYLSREDGRLERVGFEAADQASAIATVLGSLPGRGLGVAAKVATTGQALRGEEAGAALPHVPSERATDVEKLRALGARSWMLVPITESGRPIGALSFIRTGATAYDDADFVLAEELGARASATLERSWLHDATESARRQAELAADHVARLQVLTSALSEAVTADDVARAFVEQGLKATGADAITIYQLEGDELHLLRSSGLAPEIEERARRVSLARTTPEAQAIRNGVPVWVRDEAEYAARSPAWFAMRGRRMRALAWIPLSIEQRLIGMVAFGFKRNRDFPTEEQAFLVTAAHQSAQALDRARLYEAERRSNREAQEANRLKDEFLSVVSHELRTPLTAILGWSKILLSQAHKPEQLARGLAVIERNARAQVRIIDDILDVSRIITGKLRISLRETDLGGVAAAALDVLRPTAEAKGVRLDARIEPGSPTVLGDPDRLQQVAWNLLSNAIKFTPPGGDVKLEVGRTAGGVQLRVTDSGAGIRPEFLPYVFDRFRQGDSSSTREHGGLGLGLAIVRHLVELHGGSVRAESRGAGAGASFTVVFPALRQGHVPPRPEPEPFPVSNEVEGVRVLLVDDEPDTLDTVAAMLTGAGAIVRTASSAGDAMAELDRAGADVLVSDLAMPGEDGFALLRRVRKHRRGATLPAIALTAYAGPDEAARATEAGFAVHLPKPVEAEALLRAVASLARAPAVT